MKAPRCTRCGHDLPRLGSDAGMLVRVFVYACRCEAIRAAPTLRA